jgi:hypothetical protein
MRGYFNGVASSIYRSNGSSSILKLKVKLVNTINQFQNRNAKVLEGQATQIEQKAEFDVAQFQKEFRKIRRWNY